MNPNKKDFDYILSLKINGNISDYKNELINMTKKEMLKFIEYAEANGQKRHITINDFMRCECNGNHKKIESAFECQKCHDIIFDYDD